MKILTVCEHGNVRSVACAYLIKSIYKHDTLACGVKETSEETKKMLYDWADKVILMDKSLLLEFGYLDREKNKLSILDVGKDVWHNSNAQELHHKILKQIKLFNL